jgi:predicted transposase YbfD/YdcC
MYKLAAFQLTNMLLIQHHRIITAMGCVASVEEQQQHEHDLRARPMRRKALYARKLGAGTHAAAISRKPTADVAKSGGLSRSGMRSTLAASVRSAGVDELKVARDMRRSLQSSFADSAASAGGPRAVASSGHGVSATRHGTQGSGSTRTISSTGRLPIGLRVRRSAKTQRGRAVPHFR